MVAAGSTNIWNQGNNQNFGRPFLRGYERKGGISMFKLFQNELMKIFTRPGTYVMIIAYI